MGGGGLCRLVGTKESMQWPGLPCQGPQAGRGAGQSSRPQGETAGPRGAAQAAAWGRRTPSPCSPFPLALVQEGGGEAWGRTTGAKALFCFTAEMTLAGENEKMPCVLLQFEGRVTEEAAMVGLDGTTVTKQTCQDARRGRGHTTEAPGRAWSLGPQSKHEMSLARPLSGQQASSNACVDFGFQLGSPGLVPIQFGFRRVTPRGPLPAHFRRPRGCPASRATLPCVPAAHTTEHPSNAHT